jgi:error-prone DNA polymerase
MLMPVELHARSAFSFLEGASLPEELASRAAELGITALALMDRDGVYGAPRFHLAMKKLGLTPHIGAEVTGTEGFCYPLLVETRAGYQNLCRLITRMKLRAAKGKAAATDTEIAGYAHGLICLTGGKEGPLAAALARGGLDFARQCLERLCAIFGRRNVYIELQRHFTREEEARNHIALEIARHLNLPVVATNGSSYAVPEQRKVLDVFTCIRNHTTLDAAGRLVERNAEAYLKSPAQMARLFEDLPQALAGACELSSRLSFTLDDLGYEFPRYPVPEGETIMSFLRKRTEEGALDRYQRSDKRAWKQIEHELSIIEKLGLAGYFLIVWDIVRYCREQGILVQGRGSAANSAVCYALGITAVDAVKMELLFERFLSEERGEWPDIDLDLPSGDQRERAIQYVYERYGKLGAAMTANVITYRPRSAVRDAGKTLGFTTETLDLLSRAVAGWEHDETIDSLDRSVQQAGLDASCGRIRNLLEIVARMQDLPRHLGQHSGGMIVCQGQLDSVVPLEPATMPGRTVVQWDKDDCADMKMVKIDLLGLGMMAVLEESLQLVREHYGEQVDLAHLPQDDPEVYEALGKADTVGMFQIESRAQMSCLPRLRPKRFYDIVVQVAIIRPGPIVGHMVHPYLKRRQGREPVTYNHPALEPVLKRTLGIPLFQEQLLRMAMIAAGFSGGEAEELRRAFGFKRAEVRMKDVEAKLRAGMTRNGIIGETQEQIVHAITSFALYGFPESHAASFALLAYASAYLKVHYLAAFLAAMLNAQPMGFYQPASLLKDAQRHGLKVLPIDVTRSSWVCTLEESRGKLAVRLGMRYVKGLRQAAAEALMSARAKGMFRSIDDLVRRVPELAKSELMTLSEIGALNWLGDSHGLGSESKRPQRHHRRDALWQVFRAARPCGPLLESIDHFEERMARRSGQTASPLTPMNTQERLAADFGGTGMTTGPHPLAYCRDALGPLGVLPSIELASLPDGEMVKIAGGVIARQRPGTAKGFAFLSLEDETGIANVIVTPDLFIENRLMLTSEQFLMVEGRLQNMENVVSVKAESIFPLQLTSAISPSHDFH